MKLLIAMGLLVTVAAGQTPVQPVKTESQTPSLTVAFNGERGSSYSFKVTNTSSHAVTAFALRLVPSGVALVNGHYACEGACRRSITLGDSAKPAIKAGSAAVVSLPISSVNGGAVLAEAAVFNDESYEGDERAAAVLVAEQIGRQAEFDRLIAAVNGVMISGLDDTQKTTQIRIKLGELSVNLDPVMVQTFKRWFPNLASCTRRYARFMKATAVSEKNLVTNSMEQFAHGTVPGNPSLEQWWISMQQQLSSFGCTGCASLAMRPKAHSSAQNVEQGCAEDIGPILLAASDDDGSQADADEADPDMEAGLSDEEEAALDADADIGPDVRIPSRPPAKSAVISPEPTVNKGAPLRRPSAAGFPSGIPLAIAPDGRGRMLGRFNYGRRPVPDSVVYRAFFRDLSYLGDWALEDEVLWDENGRLVENHRPLAGGLSKEEIAILEQVAAEANRQLEVLKGREESIYRGLLDAAYPPGWVLYAPPIPGLRELKVQEAQALNTGIHRLKTKLGAASFSRLDGFVRQVYQGTPGKMILLHPPDEAICPDFFRYVATLDGLTDKSATAKHEAAQRHNELRSVGLQEKDWDLLIKLAKNYSQLFDRFYNNNRPISGANAPGQAVEARPAGYVRHTGTTPTPQYADLLTQVKQKGLEAKPINATASNGMAAIGMAVPAAQPTNPLWEAWQKEMEQKRDELDLEMLADLTTLKASMGDAVFLKFESYLDQLYVKAGFEIAVPLDEGKKATTTAQKKLPTPTSRETPHTTTSP